MRLVSDAQSDLPFLLTTSPPSRSQGRLAVCVLLVLVAALLVTAPFARVPLTNTEVLLPSYAGAVFVIELITSALLFSRTPCTSVGDNLRRVTQSRLKRSGRCLKSWA